MGKDKRPDVPSTHRREFPDIGRGTLLMWESIGCLCFFCAAIIFILSLFK